MIRVSFHFVGDTDLVEVWPDDASRDELRRRAIALGCRMFTPEVCDDGDGTGGVVGVAGGGVPGGLDLALGGGAR